MPTSQLNGLIPKCKNSEHQDYESMCIVQEPKISQYMQYTVAHNSSGIFSTMCHNISYLRGKVASMSNTHLLFRTLFTCTNMSWSCSVCVCVGGGGGHACVFACLLVYLFLLLRNGTWREDNSAVEDSSILGCEVCPWTVTNLKFSWRRNQRRGNVVYHTQNGVGCVQVFSG